MEKGQAWSASSMSHHGGIAEDNNCGSRSKQIVPLNNDKNANPDDDDNGNSTTSPSDQTVCQSTKDLSMKVDMTEGCTAKESIGSISTSASMVRDTIMKEICQGVIRCKLMKRRHLIIKEGIDPLYLKEIFPSIIHNFQPQPVQYNGGIANIKTWKISCYLEVMDHGVPTTQPNLLLLQHCLPLLRQCNDLFLFWYQQQHKFSIPSTKSENGDSASRPLRCRRLMTFITRYTPAPNEQALLKVRSRGVLLLIESKALE